MLYCLEVQLLAHIMLLWTTHLFILHVWKLSGVDIDIFVPLFKERLLLWHVEDLVWEHNSVFRNILKVSHQTNG